MPESQTNSSGAAQPAPTIQPAQQGQLVPASVPPAPIAEIAEPAPVTSTQSFDIEKGLNNYFMTEATYKLKANDAAGHGYEVTHKIVPIPSTRYLNIDPDNDIRGTYESVAFVIDGKAQNAVGAPFPSEFAWSGLFFKMGSPFIINGYSEFNMLKPIAKSTPLPSMAKVGEAGDLVLLAEKVWTNGTTAEQDLFGWSLDPDTADTAWLCFTERTLTTVGTTASTSEIQARRCAKIAPAGAVLGAKVDVLDGGRTIRFR
jgi:hypothetical protein